MKNVNAFREKYSTDDRAWQYLLQSSAEVQARVLEEFTPPGGNAPGTDHSKALTFFIRRCRDDEKSGATATARSSAGSGSKPVSLIKEQLAGTSHSQLVSLLTTVVDH